MERERSGFATYSIVFLSFLAGSIVGNLAQSHSDNADNRVRDVQVHNAQLQNQLSGSYDPLDNLVLTNGDNKTFTFHTKNQIGQDEACNGKYQVHDHTAAAIGNVACTVTVPAH